MSLNGKSHPVSIKKFSSVYMNVVLISKTSVAEPVKSTWWLFTYMIALVRSNVFLSL